MTGAILTLNAGYSGLDNAPHLVAHDSKSNLLIDRLWQAGREGQMDSERFTWLGVGVDLEVNHASASGISAGDSDVDVSVMATDEAAFIAHQVRDQLLSLQVAAGNAGARNG